MNVIFFKDEWFIFGKIENLVKNFKKIEKLL